MSIWYNKATKLSDLVDINSNTMAQQLGMEWVSITATSLSMKMPVDHRTKQPFGILHGGASCALAETVGSVASQLVINRDKYICVGLEINANHLKSVTEGYVTAVCTPIHIGKSTHVWDIRIYNLLEQLICISRLTVAILEKK
jgi:1,4-dihydroxy-2-naphthoyl-CoA hydrolase